MLEPGDRIGDWIIDKTLGEGGMGAVFLAHNTLSQKVRAAIKVLKPHNMGDARKRFVREVELLASVQHPAVVRVLGCGEDDTRGLLFMAMELLDGEELTDRLKRGPLPFDEAQKYFKMLGEGLLAAHQKGVVHRDIKPQNIMICTDGTAKLLDFGIAMQTGGTKLTKAGMVPGTIAYMPPEVFGGQRPDHRADVYALGLVLWEALTGQEAYPEDGGLTPDQNTVKMMGSKLQAEAFDPGDGFPEPIRDLVKAATEPEPDTRLNDLDAFVKVMQGQQINAADLAPQAAGGTFNFDVDKATERYDDAKPKPISTRPAPAQPAPKSGGGAMRWVIIALVLLLLLGGGGAVLLFGGGIAAVFGGGLAAFFLAADPVPPTNGGRERPPPAVVETVDAPKAVAAPGGWHKGVGAGLPSKFPFPVPKDAEITNAMNFNSGSSNGAMVIYDTNEATETIAATYRREAEALGLAVYESKSGHTISVSGIGGAGTLAMSLEEYKKATTVTVTWLLPE